MTDENRTVEAERRRHTETPGGGRKRAEAPQRRESSSSGGGSGGSGIPSGSGGLSFPSGKGPKSIAGMILMLMVICVFFVIQNFIGGDNTDQTPADTGFEIATQAEQVLQQGALPVEPTQVPRPTRTPKPTAVSAQSGAAAGSQAGQTWLVMMYEDADDKILEQDIYVDLNEAERAGSDERVKIVAQVDRFRGAYSGDGDWTGAKRFFITQDDDLQQVNSEVVEDLGEVNMSDSKTLIDFVTWAMQTYPADKYVLIMSDHGMGWPGGWSDPVPGGQGDPRIPLAARLGNNLYLNEIDSALEQIRSRTGLDKFELIGMDACLMGQLEVFSALAPHARYAVGSEEVEPALGWAYTGFLDALKQNPNMDGAELGQLIVQSYINDDQRIVDRNARAEFLRQGSPLGSYGDISAAQLARQISQTSTLTAVDLSAMPQVLEDLNQLAFQLQNIRQQPVARARSYAQSFTSIFGSQVPASYVDLGNFLSMLKDGVSDQEVKQTVDNLQTALEQAILAEKHGPKKPGATGITIYFPNSQLYQSPLAGAESYTAIADRFAGATLWDDFLAFHYTGQSFDEAAAIPVVPSGGAQVRAPGAGQISLSPIRLSAKTAAPGQSVTLSADVSGENLGHIYILTGYYDQAANSILIADRDFLQSSDTRQIDGVYYPDWGTGDFTLKFKWEPLVFAINDGENTVTALFTPRSYGETWEQAIYTVDGVYTYADSNDQRAARLVFSNGSLQQVLGFTGEADASAPREIIPQAGDTFTVQDTWLDLDSSGNVKNTATQEGGTLTFGDQMFTWEEMDAAPGNYIVGFVAEDLDGNSTQSLTNISVR